MILKLPLGNYLLSELSMKCIIEMYNKIKQITYLKSGHPYTRSSACKFEAVPVYLNEQIIK